MTQLQLSISSSGRREIFPERSQQSLILLCIEASRIAQGLLLTHTKYITDLLAMTHILSANPVSTPQCFSLGIYSSSQPVIYCNNVGTTYLCANPVFHSRMKYVVLDYHLIHQLVQSGFLHVSHVASAYRFADALIKPLSRPRLQLFNDKIGLSTVHTS